MKTLLRYILVAVVLIGGYSFMSYIQQRFDHADLRKAIEAVQSTKPKGPDQPTLEARLSKQLGVPASQIHWETQIESKWRGVVVVKARALGDSEVFSWTVDLARQSVMPRSEAAKTMK